MRGAYLEGEKTCGNADYVIAERRGYLEAPFVCVIEAKKDDFEQGTAPAIDRGQILAELLKLFP